MKIQRQPAILYDPSSFTIAKARILPNADTMRLTTYHNAILHLQISTKSLINNSEKTEGEDTDRFWTSYRIYQQLNKYIQQGKNPASKIPINILQTTITLQSFANPIPSITAPQLTAKPHSCCRGPMYRRERVEGSSNRKYVMKKTRRAIE
jgi:hypothetical protein